MPVMMRPPSSLTLRLAVFVVFIELSFGQTGLFQSERYDTSLNQQIEVVPEDATCGVGSAKSVIYQGSYITCQLPSCNRTYPRLYSSKTQYITDGVTFEPDQCVIDPEFGSPSDYYSAQVDLEGDYFTGGSAASPGDDAEFRRDQCWYSFAKGGDWPQFRFSETYTVEFTPASSGINRTLFLVPAAEFEVYLAPHPVDPVFSLILNHKRNEREYGAGTIIANQKHHVAIQLQFYVEGTYSQTVTEAAVFIDGSFVMPLYLLMNKGRKRREIVGERGVSVRLGAPHPPYGAPWSDVQPSCQLLSIPECVAVESRLGVIGAAIISNLTDIKTMIAQVKSVCTSNIEEVLFFACAQLFPPCTRSARIMEPCESTCAAAADNCPELLSILNLPSGGCKSMPSVNCVDDAFTPAYGFFKGDVHSFDLYGEILTNREISALAEGVLPEAQPVKECLCPEDYPALHQINPNKCVRQGDQFRDNVDFVDRVLRGDSYHPLSNIVDSSSLTSWISTPGMKKFSIVIRFQQQVIMDRLLINLETAPPVDGIKVFSKSEMTGDEWRFIAHISHNCSALGFSADSYNSYWFQSDDRCHENARWMETYQTAGEELPILNWENYEYYIRINTAPQGSGDETPQLDWIDNTFLRYAIASELKLEFHGFPKNVSNARGGSSTELFHAVSSIDAFGWDYDTSACNCHPLGVADTENRCDGDGKCLCRTRDGENSLGNNQCTPYVTDIYPHVGPISGGTHVFLFGGFFGSNNSTWRVDFGGIPFDIVFINDTLIQVTSPNMTSNQDDLLGRPLPLQIVSLDQYNYNIKTDAELDAFTYKPDPIIETIEPLSTFIRGGIDQTVTGQYLDSVAHPLFHVTVIYRGEQFKQAPTVCTVLNTTTYTCPTPEILNIPNNFENSRKKRQAGLINEIDRKEFYVGFKLDGVMTYDNVSETLPEYGSIQVFSDPKINRFDPEVQVFKTRSMTTINIEGEQMNYGCQLKDYEINIGTEVCQPVNLYTNEIHCEPPVSKPELGNYNDGDHPRVTAKVGNINIIVGYLRYEETLWDNPAFRAAIIGTICGVLALILLIAVIVFMIKRRKKPPYALGRKAGHLENDYIGMGSLESGRRPLITLLDDNLRSKIEKCMVDNEKMILGKPLGKGNFGMVYAGIISDTNNSEKSVAIKTVKGVELTAQQKIEFVEEATIMMDFKHENVLSLTGICIKDDLPYVILPLMENGDLKTFTSSAKQTFTVKDLMTFALQVARGMAYLADKKFIHRDLAARNCMVDKDWLVKIADFGLARDLFQKDYYKVQDKQRPLPVKWMAIESLEGHKFSSKSDMWSYGILFWELLTRGQRPYADVNNHEMKQYLSIGRRLSQPQLAPDEVYELMLSCWRENPEERPKFSEVAQKLEELLGVSGARGQLTAGESDGYLAPSENSPRENRAIDNPDYIILLNTEAPAPYGPDEGYLPMDGSSISSTG